MGEPHDWDSVLGLYVNLYGSFNDPATSDTTKAQRYFAFMRDTAYANAKIKAVTFWHFDAAADDTGTSYSMESQSDLHIVRYNF